MKQDFFEFSATHKFTVAANHKPTVSDTTESFWRRMRLVPFNVQIPKERRDKGLGDQLKAEAAGILAWMVKGSVLCSKDGRPDPPEITGATDDYRDEQALLAPFMHECCEPCRDEREEAQVGVLHKCFVKWCEENGEESVSRKKLSAMLKERGYEN